MNNEIIKLEFNNIEDIDYTKVIDVKLKEPIILYWKYEDIDTNTSTIMATIGFVAELDKKYISIARSLPWEVMDDRGIDDYFVHSGISIIGYKKLN